MTELAVAGGRITATVDGAGVHRVELQGTGKSLSYSCACEDSGDGSFCEHMVGAGLASIAGTTKLPPPPAPAVTKQDVRAHLLTVDKEKLVDILMLRADWDKELRDQLFVEAAMVTVRRRMATARGRRIARALPRPTRLRPRT